MISKIKKLFEESGLKILPDMTMPVGRHRGHPIIASSFKLEKSKMNVEDLKIILEKTDWKEFAFYQVHEPEDCNFIVIRGYAAK